MDSASVLRGLVAGGLLVAVAACSSSSPTEPSAPGTSAFTAAATVIDAVTGQPIAGVTATGSEITGGPSTATGTLTVSAAAGSANARMVTFTVSGYVNRSVAMKVAGTAVTVSMIPAAFSLNAFDELLRTPHLRRWTTTPALRLQTRTLTFEDVNQADAVAEDVAWSDGEVAVVETDLLWALPQLTGGTFQAFSSTTRQTAAVGERVSLLNTGVITVARMRGLRNRTGFAGYGRWQFQNDGTVVGGSVMLDYDFELLAPDQRRAVRAHELGHALGYDHVSSVPSLMNATGRSAPVTFDLEATTIAFRRPPGNVRPDADPSSASLNSLRAAQWSRGAGLVPGAALHGYALAPARNHVVTSVGVRR